MWFWELTIGEKIPIQIVGKYCLEGDVHMVVFCFFALVFSEITIFLCVLRGKIIVQELSYFRVQGAELCKVYEMFTYRTPRKIIYQASCNLYVPKFPREVGNNILLMLSKHLNLHQNEIGRNWFINLSESI